MNQALNKSKTLNCKMPITIFSLISFLCVLLCSIRYFVKYTVENISGELVYKSAFEFPTLFGILFLVADILPCTLLAFYILKFHKKSKAKIFMPIIFGTFVYEGLLVFIRSIIYFDYSIIEIIIFSIQIITFLSATISSLKGFPKKFFPVLTLCIALITEIYYIINFFNEINWFVEYSIFSELILIPLGLTGFTSLFIALLMFVLYNTPILAVSPEKEKKNAKKMTPEQSLRLLNDKLELGMITEEEYKAQRTEIINNL